jgi:hypothetical protein
MIIRKTLALATLLAGFSTQAHADNCDFSKLNFGSTQEKLKSDFKLNSMDVPTDGEGIISVGAAEICKDLPPAAKVDFRLIDNNFVQLSVTTENVSNKVFDFAIKTFGDQDNFDKDDEKKLALWNKDNQYSVIYKTFQQGRHNLENLVVTSSKHKALFDKQNKKDDEEASAADKKK